MSEEQQPKKSKRAGALARERDRKNENTRRKTARAAARDATVAEMAAVGMVPIRDAAELVAKPPTSLWYHVNKGTIRSEKKGTGGRGLVAFVALADVRKVFGGAAS